MMEQSPETPPPIGPPVTPGYSAPPPAPPRKRLSFFGGLLVLLMIGFLGVVFVIAFFAIGRSNLPSFGQSVAIVDVLGPIVDSGATRQQLQKARDDSSIKAIVLRIESPGGAVGASQEIYEELKLLGIPVVASMGNTAASGGYYIACGADHIVANPGTLTGSIGVIVTLPSGEKLIEKVGLDVETITSGKFKANGSMWKKIDDDGRELLQTAVNDIFDQFLQAVLDSRGAAVKQQLLKRRVAAGGGAADVTSEEAEAYLRADVADGRILTGRQALDAGLVDQLGSFDDAIRKAAKLAGIDGEPTVKRLRREPTLLDALSGRAQAGASGNAALDQLLFYLTDRLAPGFSIQYRMPF